MHLTYKEIRDQYNALRQTFNYIETMSNEIQSLFQKRKPERMIYAGCGSGYCLCRAGAESAAIRLGLPSAALAAGDLMLHTDNYVNLFKNGMIIAPSRSGSTSEVINAVKAVRRVHNLPLVAIACVKDSPLSELADLTLELPWAFDESVCQTRTVCNLYAANLLMLAHITADKALIAEINRVITAGETYMDKYEEAIRKLAETDFTNVVLLADGEAHGVAAEGALALVEIAQMHASAHHLLDVRHGPMVMIDSKTIVIALLSGDGSDYERALLVDIAEKGATIITFSDCVDKPIENASLHIAANVGADTPALAIPFLYIPQTLAYYSALHRGLNPDTPSGLDPWIKL